MKLRTPYILAILIFVCSFALRLAFISKGPFHGDCMSLVIQAQQTASTGKIHYLHSHGFPMTAILSGFFVWIFQTYGLADPVFAVNMMSVLFSSLTVLILFLLIRIWFNERTAFFSSAIFSITPIFLTNSVYGNSHMPAFFFIALSFYWLWNGYFQNGNIRALTLPAILFGIGIATRAQDAVLLFPIIILCLFIHPTLKTFSIKKKLGSIMAFIFISVSTGALFYIPVLKQKFMFTNQPHANLVDFLKGELFSHIATDFWVFLPLCFQFLLNTITPIGILLSICGIIFLIQEKRFSDVAVLLAWFVIPFYFFSSLNFYLPRFFMLCLIPICVTIGISCNRLLNYKGWIAILTLSAWILFLMAVPLSTAIPVLQSRHDHAYMPEFVRWVKKTIEPNAQVIISDGSDFFRYYGPVNLLGRPLYISHYPNDAMRKFQQDIDQTLAQGVPVYITSNGLYSYNPEKTFSSFMRSSYCLKLIGLHPVELWHHGALEQRVPLSGLYRVYPKNPLPQN